MNFEEKELIWAAGFFDGEGGSTVNTNLSGTSTTVSIQLKVKQNDRRPLDRFLSAVGAGKVYGPYNSKGNPYYSWVVGKKASVFEVFFKLAPYLSEPKKEQMWNDCVKLQVLQDEFKIKSR